MLLVMDIGNSTISLGGYAQDQLVFHSDLSTNYHDTPYQYASILRQLLGLKGTTPKPSKAILCSVVPHLTKTLCSAVEIAFGVTPVVLAAGIKTGLNINIDVHTQLGADLVAASVAASVKYKLPCVVYDIGTATTVSVLAKDGVFLGNIICAGPAIALEALTKKTAQLYDVALDEPDRLIGRNTDQAMKSGLIYGTAAMLDGLAQRIEHELGESCTHVTTGGLSTLISSFCLTKLIHDPFLLFEGLKIIYYKNKPQGK